MKATAKSLMWSGPTRELEPTRQLYDAIGFDASAAILLVSWKDIDRIS